MIKVNLLPIEKRKAEGTPLPRFMAIVGGVVASLLLLVGFAFIWLQAGAVDREIGDLDSQIAQAKQKTLQKNALEAQVKGLRGRNDAIVAIEKSRSVLWAERLDRLAQVLDKQARKVWLVGIKGTDTPTAAAVGVPQPAGAAKPAVLEATFELACKSCKDLDRGTAVGIVTADFVEAIRREFIEGDNKDFTKYDPMYAESLEAQSNFVEGHANTFTLKLFRERSQTPPKPVAPPK